MINTYMCHCFYDPTGKGQTISSPQRAINQPLGNAFSNKQQQQLTSRSSTLSQFIDWGCCSLLDNLANDFIFNNGHSNTFLQVLSRGCTGFSCAFNCSTRMITKIRSTRHANYLEISAMQFFFCLMDDILCTVSVSSSEPRNKF